ncbi:MAG TPA: type II toxin-antitoxin system RelE/ParE family toxin [Thermaerobacter sp.]
MTAGPWRIVVSKEAEKTLRRLDRSTRLRLRDAIDRLAEGPHPAPGRDVRPLQGHPGLYRLRVGDWRVLFAVEEAEQALLVLAIRPRGQAYRRLEW